LVDDLGNDPSEYIDNGFTDRFASLTRYSSIWLGNLGSNQGQAD
jgi:hypothetical protein